MNLNSRLFDRIRIKAASEKSEAAPEVVACDHAGCKRAGAFRAPKGRGREGQFFLFCAEHVKAYNATYNYFAGMDDAALAEYQKEAVVGHRPTWKTGVNAKAQRTAQRGVKRDGAGTAEIQDGFGLFGERNAASRAKRQEDSRLGALSRQAFATLGLDETADKATIKARYKELVKRFHPDANGGDRSREERLAEILKAYGHLKTARLV
jgi:hypothetical protein